MDQAGLLALFFAANRRAFRGHPSPPRRGGKRRELMQTPAGGEVRKTPRRPPLPPTRWGLIVWQQRRRRLRAQARRGRPSSPKTWGEVSLSPVSTLSCPFTPLVTDASSPLPSLPPPLRHQIDTKAYYLAGRNAELCEASEGWEAEGGGTKTFAAMQHFGRRAARRGLLFRSSLPAPPPCPLSPCPE